jgi:hypothetical protein
LEPNSYFVELRKFLDEVDSAATVSGTPAH